MVLSPKLQPAGFELTEISPKKLPTKKDEQKHKANKSKPFIHSSRDAAKPTLLIEENTIRSQSSTYRVLIRTAVTLQCCGKTTCATVLWEEQSTAMYRNAKDNRQGMCGCESDRMMQSVPRRWTALDTIMFYVVMVPPEVEPYTSLNSYGRQLEGRSVSTKEFSPKACAL